MNPPWLESLERQLQGVFTGARIRQLRLLAGGASKETWALDLSTANAERELVVRRAGGGAMQSEQLSLQLECAVIQAVRAAGVSVPEPLFYLPDLAGREAFVSERWRGESIGRRVVSRQEFASARAELPQRMAEELARIHATPLQTLEALPGARDQSGARYAIAHLYRELDALQEPHPAIELALEWLSQHEPVPQGHCLVHGDFRIGNLLVSQTGLSGVLDWEFAHIGDPAEDLGWPLLRAWRFGQDACRLGGIGPVEPFLAHYNQLSGRNITLETLAYWELLGNARWAIGALSQARRHLEGQERNVELAALGRVSGDIELELLELLTGRL